MYVIQGLEQRVRRVGPYAVEPFENARGDLLSRRAFFGMTRRGGQRVVLKLANPAEARNLAALRRELDVLRRLRHPSLVKLVDEGTFLFRFLTGESVACPYAVLEAMDADLFDATGGGALDLPWRLTLGVLRAVAEGVAHLHGQGIVHGDIKIDNVLVRRGVRAWRAKLADLGESRDASSTEARVLPGLNDYQPRDSHWGPGVDVYSLGVLVHDLTRTRPFRHCGMRRRCTCPLRPTVPPAAGARLAELVRSATEPRATRRMSALELVRALARLARVAPPRSDAETYARLLFRHGLLEAWGSPEGPVWLRVPGARATLPGQGWKIHVGLEGPDALITARRVLGLARRRGWVLKALGNLRDLAALNAGTFDPTLRGKALTLYPRDEAEFREALAALRRSTRGLRGMTAPGDFPVPGSTLLGYRYGPFVLDDVEAPEGAFLRAPSGARVKDVRDRPWAPPWAPDPLRAP